MWIPWQAIKYIGCKFIGKHVSSQRSDQSRQLSIQTNFKIQKYCKNKPKFKGFYSQNNLPKTMGLA